MEDYNREGCPSDRLEEIIRQLIPKAIHGPMGIREFIKEQQVRLSGSSSNSSIDTNTNSNSRTDGSDDHSTKGLTKEERDYLEYNNDNDSYNDSYGDSISNSDSEGSHSSNSYEGSFDSKLWTQLALLDPTEDQIFIMAHVKLAYREKRAHVIRVQELGYANGGEGLDDHITALCSKMSKDQIVFPEEQYE